MRNNREGERARHHQGDSHDRRIKARDEWICGLNPVLEAVRSDRQVFKVFLSLSRREKTTDIEAEIARRGITVQKADLHFFESRFHKGHQGIAALVAPRKYADFNDLLEIPPGKGEVPLILVIDCIEDPRNFGSILRVADAGGVHGVVIQSHRSVSLTTEAVKASAGAAEHVQIAMVPNIKHTMRTMKENGITIIGAEADSGTVLWEADLAGPLALVIGSEGKGLRKTVKENCDMLVSIPMKGHVNSLNASVATGMIIYEINRQRNREKKIF